MTKLFFGIISSLLFFLKTDAQKILFNDAKLQELRIQENQYFNDSLNTVGSFAPLEAHTFRVIFYSAVLNKRDSTLTLDGNVYFSTSQRGINGVSIFMGIRIGDTLTRKSEISETSNDNGSKDGSFRLKLKPCQKESLYFYLPYYYLVEFDIWKLVFN